MKPSPRHFRWFITALVCSPSILLGADSLSISGRDGFFNGIGAGYFGQFYPGCCCDSEHGNRCSLDTSEFRMPTFEIQGTPGASVLLEFSLPSTVQQLPQPPLDLVFNGTSATVGDGSSGEMFYFDPTQPTVTRVQSSGFIHVTIGAFVRGPRITLPQWMYSCPIICRASITEPAKGRASVFYSDTVTVKFIVISPISFNIVSSHPNPFNPSTTIRYELPITTNVKLSIHDMIGQAVATLVDEEKPAGTYEVVWDAGNLPTGVYICEMASTGIYTFRKLVLIR